MKELLEREYRFPPGGEGRFKGEGTYSTHHMTAYG